MNRLVMRADVDGGSTVLGSYENFDAAFDAVLANGWIPRDASYCIAGATDYADGGDMDGLVDPPGFAAFLVDHGEELFVLAIVRAT